MINSIGSASSAMAAGSATAVRARARPTAADPSVNGSERASISRKDRASGRPEERLIAIRMQRSAINVQTRTPTRTASQSRWPTPGEESATAAWATSARDPERANWATLKASFMPRCRRCTTRLSPVPSTWALTTWAGAARHMPAASTRSLREKVCESRSRCTCTTRASLTAKARTQAGQGMAGTAAGPGRGATTTANNATAAAATPAASSQIRWEVVNRSRERAPFAIVVTSSGPVRAGPGHARPGHAGPGHARPAHARPAHARPAHARPGHARPAHPGPGHAGPAHPGPVGPVAQAGRPRADVERPPADVDLTADLPGAHSHVHRPACELQRTQTRRHREPLHGVRGGCRPGLGQVDQTGALLRRGGVRDRVRGPHQQCLDLVRGGGRPLLDPQGSRTGDHRGGLGGTATAEQPVTDPGL